MRPLKILAPILSSLALALGVTACADTSKPAAAEPARVSIAVTEAGFTPGDVHVTRGKPVTLVFERKVEKTCATEVVLEVGGKKLEKELPLNTPVEVAVTFPTSGKLQYACGMDMVHGIITVD